MNYIIFKDENALYYECNYSCDNAIFIKLGSSSFFITDGRYEIDAKEMVKDAKVIISNSLLDKLVDILKKEKPKKINIDPIQWDILSFNKLKSLTPVKLNFKPNFSHKKRIIKSEDELLKLKKAVKIGKKSFKEIATNLVESTGSTELELNFLAESILRDFGNRDISFEPILAINENASKPHATPSKKALNCGDLLLLDAGVKYQRYCSDRTRTVNFDEEFKFSYKQNFNSKFIQKAYDTVLKAHDKAINKAKSGMRAKDIDKLARGVIEKAGFGKYFVHSTGHGVGLDIHEMPYISSKSDTVIEDGMVYTIEPGIYIEGEFGIRIEDMVVMKNSKAIVL